MATAVVEGSVRSTTFVVTVRVVPDRLIELPTMSIPGRFAPPMTGYRASPDGSVSPVTGAFEGPDTCVPYRPGPDDWRAMVKTPAPAWSTSCWFPGVNPGW